MIQSIDVALAADKTACCQTVTADVAGECHLAAAEAAAGDQQRFTGLHHIGDSLVAQLREILSYDDGVELRGLRQLQQRYKD